MRQSALDLIARAHGEGRNTLLEPELYTLLAASGVPTPVFFTVNPADFPKELPVKLPGSRAVVKVVSPEITHKTEMGGVTICENSYDAIKAATQQIMENVRTRGGEKLAATVRQILVSEFVEGTNAFGGQVFAGMRHSPDMGPVLALGFGGLDAKEMAASFKTDQGLVLGSLILLTPEQMLEKLRGSYLYRRITGKTREAKKLVDDSAILAVLRFFNNLAALSGSPELGFIIQDFEVNPFFTVGGRLVAVDAFMRFSKGVFAQKQAPLDQIQTLLNPRTVAIIGASGKGMNPGRIILRNLLSREFPTENIRVIRPDGEAIDGVDACASLSELPWKADLVVVSVAASAVLPIIEEALAGDKAASMILIPGGLGETEAGKADAKRILDQMANARAKGLPTPVLVGPNCLGIRSNPGRYDTLFIPTMKLPLSDAPESRCALISQSGAFLITRINNLTRLNAKYSISTGNQMDLSLVDFVEAILAQDSVDVFGLYIEGFGPLDGLKLAGLVQKARASGKDVIVYKAGRTPEGSTATSSHTASISGDYASAVQVLKDAGALLTNSFAEFNLLLDLAVRLHDKKIAGNGIGAISNAGYETVGMADNLSQKPKFQLVEFSQKTQDSLEKLMAEYKLASLVTVHNPLDITPMAPDIVYCRALEAVVQDPAVDAVVVGVVPLSPVMKTMPVGADPSGLDSVDAPEALPTLFPPVIAKTDKPVIVSVDAGPLYDPLVEAFERNGIPTYRTVDGAMAALQKYMAYRLNQVGR